MNACPACDTVWNATELPQNCAAHCSRCGHHLSTNRTNAFEHALAFTWAGLILLAIAATHPFLLFAASGRQVSMTLFDSAFSLFEYGQGVLGSVVFTFVFVAPAALLLTQALLLRLLISGRPSIWLWRFARVLDILKTWNMIEVFLISVFVSAAKLASMAELDLGVAFFAFVGFTLCTLISVNLIDTVQLWRRIEALDR